MTFFGRITKYNPYHDKDGKFTEAGNAQGVGSLDGVANLKHDNPKALAAVMGVFEKKFTQATYKDHAAQLRQFALNAIGGHPGWDTATKTSFIMSQLKGHYSGFKTPSKEIRSKIETKVSYKAGNKMYKALHEALTEHELKGDHGLTVEHVAAPEFPAPEPEAPKHIPEVAITPIVDEPAKEPRPEKTKPAADIYTLTEPEPAAPAKEPRPLDLAGMTPMMKFKAIASDHVVSLAGKLPLTQLSGVVGKVHSAYMAAKSPEDFETKAAFGVEDLVSTGKLSPSSANQIHAGDWKPLYGKLNDALTGKTVAPAPAPAPAPTPAAPAAAPTLTGEQNDKFWGGMGVVNDHVPDLNMKEYQETKAKFKELLAAGKSDAEIVDALGSHLKGYFDTAPALDVIDKMKPALAAKLAGKAIETTSTAQVPAAAKEPDVKPVAETSITSAQKVKPVPTGDKAHDLVMNMLHAHGGEFTPKEHIVASNLAKSNLGVADDGKQFFDYVNTDLDNYAAKYPQNVPHLDAMKGLPWDHVYADAKSLYGDLPTDWTATDEALHAKSFPAAPAKAPEPAPAPAPAPTPAPALAPATQSTASHAAIPDKLAPLSIKALDEELHNQLNNHGMKGQGSASHKIMANYAEKAFLAAHKAAQASPMPGQTQAQTALGHFKKGFLNAIQVDKGKAAADKVSNTLDTGALFVAMQDGDHVTPLSADVPQGGIAWKEGKVYTPNSQAVPYDDPSDDDDVTNEMKAKGHATASAAAVSHKSVYSTFLDQTSGSSSWTGKHALKSKTVNAIEKALPKCSSHYDLKFAAIQEAKNAGVKFGAKTKGMYNMLDWKGLFEAGQAAGKTKGAAPAATSAPSTASPAITAGPKAKAALESELQALGYGSQGMTGAKINTALDAALAAGKDFNGADLKSGVLRHMKVMGAEASASVAEKLDWTKIHSAHNEDLGLAPTIPAAAPAAKKPAADHVKNMVMEKAKAAGINPYAIEQMGSAALLAHANVTTVDAKSFKDNAMSELDAKVTAGVLKPSPSVDKLKNNIDWSAAYEEAGKPKPAAGARTKNGHGDTSANGDYTGFKRYDKSHSALGDAMNQRPLSSNEKEALNSYKGSGYDAINAQLRQGKMLSPHVGQNVLNLLTGTTAGTVPAGTMLYRGMPNYEEIGFSDLENAVKQGKVWHDNGFLSVSSSRQVADSWSLGGGGSGPKSVLFEMKITKPVPGVHIGKARGSGDGEQEIVMPAQTLWKIAGVRKGDGMKKWVVTLETL